MLVLMFVQAALGIHANRSFDETRLKTPVFPDGIHYLVGNLLMLAGGINCFLGMMMFTSSVDSLSNILIIAILLLMTCFEIVGHFQLNHNRHTHGVKEGGPSVDDEKFNSGVQQSLLGTSSVVGKYTARQWFRRAIYVCAVAILIAISSIALGWQRVEVHVFGWKLSPI